MCTTIKFKVLQLVLQRARDLRLPAPLLLLLLLLLLLSTNATTNKHNKHHNDNKHNLINIDININKEGNACHAELSGSRGNLQLSLKSWHLPQLPEHLHRTVVHTFK